MKLNAKEILRPAIMLFVICLVVTGLLAGSNLLTKDMIEQQNIAAEQASRKVVLPTAENFDAVKASGASGDYTYYIGKDSGGTVAGWVFTTKAKGYGGDVNVMTGITADGKVSGVTILSHNETPGLGANAEKENYRNQYQQPIPSSGFGVIKSGSPTDGQISAMTGATITSNAVTTAVNEAITNYQAIKGGM